MSSEERNLLDLPLRGETGKTPSESRPQAEQQPAPEPTLGSPLPRRGPTRNTWSTGRRALVFFLLALAAVAGYLIFWPKPALPVFSLSGMNFGTLRMGETSEPLEVTVTNEGERNLGPTEIRITGEAASDYSIVAEDCAGTLRAPLESCTIRVDFRPASRGNREAALKLIGNAGAALPLAGKSVAPRVRLDPAGLDFGPQPVEGRSAGRTIDLVNDGTADLLVDRILLDGKDQTDYKLVGRCSTKILTPGETCPLRIAFEPRAAGARTAELRVESDAPEGASRAVLQGVGEWTGPTLSASPTSLAFGEQRVARTTAPQTLRLTNREGSTLKITRVDSSDRSFQIGQTSCANTSLPAGESCRISVTFSPTEEKSIGASIEIRTDGGGGASIPLTGKGVRPHLTLRPTQLEFDRIRVGKPSSDLTAELISDGSAMFRIDEISISGSAAGSFRKKNDTCSGSALQPGARCTVAVAFQPGGEGVQRAELRVRADADTDRNSLALAGTGVAPRIAVRQRALEFGSVYRTLSASQRLEIASTGTAPLLIRSLVVADNPLKEYRVGRTDCTGAGGLAPRSTCTADVVFSPVADGTRAATLVIAHDAAGDTTRVRLAGRGLTPIDGFQISPAPANFGTVQIGAWSDIETITLRNPGQGPLMLKEIELSGPAATEFRIVPGSCAEATPVSPRSDCTFGVRFQPSVAGERQAVLTIRHDAPDGSDTVSLTGTGLAQTVVPPPASIP